MSKFATVLVIAGLAVPAWAQLRPDWRHVGKTAVDLGLADLATGPVDRVWYAPDGLRIRTGLGRSFVTHDFDTWQALPATTGVPTPVAETARSVPEPGAQVRNAPTDPLRVYAFGRFVYRSEDGGRHWENTTGDRRGSIVGDGLRDLAVAPTNPDELTLAGGAGVFRSLDGGRSWHGLNDTLPNLPGARLRNVPPGAQGPQIELAGGLVLEWLSGQRRAWTVSTNQTTQSELALRQVLSEVFGTDVTAAANRGTFVYAGDANGRLSVSSDGGRTWTHSQDPSRGRVNAFWIDADDARMALAVFAVRPVRLLEPQTVLHTINGGLGWDTVASNLPATSVNGVTADRATNSVYLATDAGVYFGSLSLRSLGAPPRWTEIAGLPPAPVSDVRLDAGETQLWAAVEGAGLFATLAPHRLADPKVVSAADLLARAATAPGALLSVAGTRVTTATAGGLNVPVLYASDTESQLQIPFNAPAPFALSITGPQGRREFPPVALNTAAPVIFEVDGTPLVRDADRGVMLDGSNPARSRMRVQIMAAGLGRVRPDWPAGVPAPLENSPQVVAPVTVYLDREPIPVHRAILWPEYVGVYLIEVELPVLLQDGLAELHLNVGGHESNRILMYSER